MAEAESPVYVAAGRGVLAHRWLPVLLDGCVLPRRRAVRLQATAVLAWGRKQSATRAEHVARRLGLPVLRVEDGFIRSLLPGADEPGLSLVVDSEGIYYDASLPSTLERLIRRPLDTGQLERAEQVRRQWCRQRVSKYNHAPEPSGLPDDFVLVVDQTRGDVSIRCGGASDQSFQDMLAAALAEHPDVTLVLKLHPEVALGRKQGHFSPEVLAQHPRVRVLADDVHPVALLERARAVYVVTSQLGFEALLHGRPVHTFGLPFYAGWGLTVDRLAAPGRRTPVPLLQLVHAALIDYARYVHPETGTRCDVEALMGWLALQRQCRARFPAEVWAWGFSRWKRPIVRDFLQSSRVHFVRRATAVPSGQPCVVWGRRPVQVSGPLLRMEDGFLRSVGLGADLIRPLSWVVDPLGIYYDATTPSALENHLQHIELDEAACARARALRAGILEAGITKYNVGSGQWQRPPHGRVILVPGQVEDDQSLRYGCTDVRTNSALLAAVRQANPQAWVVYKPHPDVVSGLRPGATGEVVAGGHCDEVVIDVPMSMLLDQVDEVHVMTSLAGFEALLRERRVVCYGVPFYAGWGLTQDLARAPALARRQRRLTLDELVHGALIDYPLYVSRTTGRYTTPERALHELVAWRAEPRRPAGLRRRVLQLFSRWRRTR